MCLSNNAYITTYYSVEETSKERQRRDNRSKKHVRNEEVRCQLKDRDMNTHQPGNAQALQLVSAAYIFTPNYFDSLVRGVSESPIRALIVGHHSVPFGVSRPQDRLFLSEPLFLSVIVSSLTQTPLLSTVT